MIVPFLTALPIVCQTHGYKFAESLRFRKQAVGIPAQSVGEQRPEGITLKVQFCRTVDNVRIKIIETNNDIDFCGGLVQSQIVPNSPKSHEEVSNTL